MSTPSPSRAAPPAVSRAVPPTPALRLLPNGPMSSRARRPQAVREPVAPPRLEHRAVVSAEVSADGEGGEFARARHRVLHWVEAHAGPLPASFAADRTDPASGRPVERHRASGALVAAVDRSAGSLRYFAVSLEVGAASGLPSWKAVVILARADETSYFRAALLTPRRRRPGAWVPGVVHGLAHSPGLIDYGWRIHPVPWIIQDEEGVEGLIHLIGDPHRTRPVFATGLGGGATNPEESPMDLWDLAHRTAGLAHVVVLTGPMTYALSDRVGRNFSVFGNAVRTYRPGCVIGARSLEHPMALAETVRNWTAGGPLEFAGFLAREAARASVVFQTPRKHWLPEAVEREFPEVSRCAADPFTSALGVPTRDGDRLHPLGAGEDPDIGEEAQASGQPLAVSRAG